MKLLPRAPKRSRSLLPVVLAVLVIVGLVAGTAAAAGPDSVQGLPLPGHYFYGDVTVAGEPAEEGIIITARVDGLTFATTVDANGQYGYDPNFSIPGDNSGELGAKPGERIEFFVGGTKATDYTFESGGLTELDLAVEQVVTPSANYLYLPLVSNGR